jgi:hypothetical protein
LVFCVYLVVNLFIGVVTTEMQDAKTHALAKRKMQTKMAVASTLKKTTMSKKSPAIRNGGTHKSGSTEYVNLVLVATFEDDDMATFDGGDGGGLEPNGRNGSAKKTFADVE